MVVSNSGPIIWLSRISRFQLLRQFFHEVVIPEEVRVEVIDQAGGYPNALNVISACEAGWMKVIEVQDTRPIERFARHRQKWGFPIRCC